MSIDLNIHRVAKLPPSIYYVPNFITKEEEDYLINQVNSAPKPKWTQLSNRRLQNWGGLPHPKGMVAEDLPNWLQQYAKKISSLGIFENKTPNHVLVNEYLAGQGIMPHEDGPLYYPTVSTISLGSHTVLDFYHPLSCDESDPAEESTLSSGDVDQQKSRSLESRQFGSVLLEPRSLVLVQDCMYKEKLHGIKEIQEDVITDRIANLDLCEANEGETLKRTTRISLTIRHVPKVFKAKLLFGKR